MTNSSESSSDSIRKTKLDDFFWYRMFYVFSDLHALWDAYGASCDLMELWEQEQQRVDALLEAYEAHLANTPKTTAELQGEVGSCEKGLEGHSTGGIFHVRLPEDFFGRVLEICNIKKRRALIRGVMRPSATSSSGKP